MSSGDPAELNRSDDPEVNYVLLAYANNVNLSDRQLAIRLLNRLGVHGEFMPEDEYQESRIYAPTTLVVEPNVDTSSLKKYSIFNITKPDHYLVLEHFDDYIDYRADLTTPPGLLFGMLLVDKSLGDRRHYDVPSPPGNVIVTPRQNVGFESSERPVDRYSRLARLTAMYAVQAGSFVDYAQTLESIDRGRFSKREAGLLAIAHQVTSQFKEVTE